MNKDKILDIVALESQIKKIEGVTVFIRERSACPAVQYPYKRKAPDTFTVQKLLKTRILPLLKCPATEVIILTHAYGSAHPRTLLKTLRKKGPQMPQNPCDKKPKKEFLFLTGQKVFSTKLWNEIKEEVECPVCNKKIDLRSDAWLDPYLPPKGKYVCYEHLTAKRLEELKALKQQEQSKEQQPK
jgi:hypothetical protein